MSDSNGNGHSNGNGPSNGNGHAAQKLRKYDLVLKKGRIFDPSQGIDRIADLAILDGKIAAIESDIPKERSKRQVNVDGLLVTPGLIDLHVHCNMYRNPEALDPNFTGVQSGVCRIVDPGDSGAYVFAAFRRNVVDQATTKIHSWMSAAGLGGFMYGLYNTDIILHPMMIDVEAAIGCIAMHSDVIRGIKTYTVPEGWGNPDGSEVYDKAFQIAEQARVPLYIHSGAPAADGEYVFGEHPRLYGKERTREEILTIMLERLRPGDLVAHMFSTFHGTIWNRFEKRLAPGAREAYDRGVMFDSGRGAHFCYESIRRLLDIGILPSTISTDRHASDQHDQFNRMSSIPLTTHMSEFLAFGMTLEDVILRATYNPAKALRITDEAGSLKIGYPADITVMALREGKWQFKDNPYAFGEVETVEANRMLTPVMTCLDGKVIPCNPAFLPDLEELQVQDDVWSWMNERPERPWAYGKPEDEEEGKQREHTHV